MRRFFSILILTIFILLIFILMASCGSELRNQNVDQMLEKKEEPVETISQKPITTEVMTPEPATPDEPDSITPLFGIIGCGTFHTIGISSDNTAIFALNNDYIENDLWTSFSDIKYVAGGLYTSFGLTTGGQVLVTGSFKDSFSALNEWTDIVMIDAGNMAVAGVDKSGNGYAISSLYYDIENIVNSWDNLKSIDVSDTHVLGVKKDGTVVGAKTEEKMDSDIGTALEVNGWSDIIQAEAGQYFSLGLKSDGTLVVAGNYSMYVNSKSVQDMKDIVMISAGSGHFVGLRSDGRVISAGNNNKLQCDVGSWTEIIAVAAGFDYTIGLKKDGTVLVAGDLKSGECDVQSWILRNH